jgi:hypothetical protein
MKFIVENNTRHLTDKDCLVEVASQINNFKDEFFKIGVNPIHKRSFKRLKDDRIVNYCYYVNRIRSGLTIKFWDE